MKHYIIKFLFVQCVVLTVVSSFFEMKNYAKEIDCVSEMGNQTSTAFTGEEVDAATNENAQLLALENENIYQGMDKAYKNGYQPVISKNKVKIILPLCLIKEEKVDSIQAVLNLGDVENTPFLYKNYVKTIKKTKEKVNGTEEEKEVFLVSFQVDLQKERLNGTYPVTIEVSYSVMEKTIRQSFTVYVRITDGKENELGVKTDDQEQDKENTAGSEEGDGPPEGDNGNEKATSEPKVIVVKNEQYPEKIRCGEKFRSKVTLKNTSKEKYVQNMTVTVSCETEGVSLITDSNVFYFEKLGADRTMELPLEFKVEEKTQEGRYCINLAISYDNPDAISLTSTGNIFFQVYQNIRVDFEMGEIESEINAGDSISLPIQVMNMGRGTIYNVRCNVEGQGMTASKSLFIGNLEGGTSGSGELVLFAGMVNPEAESEKERYGRTDGKLILTYEDVDGNSYTEEKDYVTTIQAMEIKAASQVQAEEKKSIGKQLAVGIVLVIIILLLGGIMPVLSHIRKERIGNEKYDK